MSAPPVPAVSWAACSADMLFYTLGQGWVFLSCVYAGLLVGLWYDCTAALSRLFGAGTWLRAGLDMVFSLGAAAIFVGALLLSGRGEARLYALLGLLSGFCLWGFTLRRALSGLGGILSRIARAAGAWLCQRALWKKIMK